MNMYSIRRPGDTINCGTVPTGGAQHRPIEGKHVATLYFDEEGARWQPAQLRARCVCGHSWLVDSEPRYEMMENRRPYADPFKAFRWGQETIEGDPPPAALRCGLGDGDSCTFRTTDIEELIAHGQTEHPERAREAAGAAMVARLIPNLVR